MLIPLRGKLLVEILENSNKTESGLFISPKEEVPHRGFVVELGLSYIDKKGKEYPWGISIGHIVHFKRVWDQQKVKHYILKRDQIYAIEFENKSYAISEYIIVKREEQKSGVIFVPKHFESEVSKSTDIGEVISVGRDDRLGINVGDKIVYYKNEGLSVRIPEKEELWSLKPRAIIGKLL